MHNTAPYKLDQVECRTLSDYAWAIMQMLLPFQHLMGSLCCPIVASMVATIPEPKILRCLLLEVQLPMALICCWQAVP